MADPNGLLNNLPPAGTPAGVAAPSGAHFNMPQQYTAAAAYLNNPQFAQPFTQFPVSAAGQPGTQPPTSQTDQLKTFWQGQMIEVEQVGNDPAEFKNHQLPLARIKKIMKSDEDVRMISAEAPVLFAKACEMFILELTLRSWIHSEENKRRTLQRNDIAAAITRTDIFDFLVDIVPREDVKPEVPPDTSRPGVVPPPTNVNPGPAPMYFPYPAIPSVSAPDQFLPRPSLPLDPSLLYQAPFMTLPHQAWPHQALTAAPLQGLANAQGVTPPADATSQQ